MQRLLLAFPELKIEQGSVADRLRSMSAPEAVLSRFRELAAMPITPDEDDDD